MVAHRGLEHRAAAIRAALAPLAIDDLDIEVVDECVYLHGQASCYDVKRTAGETAASVAPGACIKNAIRIARTDFSDDERTVRELDAALAKLPRGAAARIRVTVENGDVRLDGMALDEQERREIETTAWQSGAASCIHNHIEILTGMHHDSDVASALSAYVERAMNLQPGVIAVEYSRGTVTLNGVVTSMTQARAIEDLVRWHDRVEDIVNNLQSAASGVTMSGAAS